MPSAHRNPKLLAIAAELLTRGKEYHARPRGKGPDERSWNYEVGRWEDADGNADDKKARDGATWKRKLATKRDKHALEKRERLLAMSSRAPKAKAKGKKPARKKAARKKAAAATRCVVLLGVAVEEPGVFRSEMCPICRGEEVELDDGRIEVDSDRKHLGCSCDSYYHPGCWLRWARSSRQNNNNRDQVCAVCQEKVTGRHATGWRPGARGTA